MSELFFVLKTFGASLLLFMVLQWTYSGKTLEYHIEDLILSRAPMVELTQVARGARYAVEDGWAWVKSKVSEAPQKKGKPTATAAERSL